MWEKIHKELKSTSAEKNRDMNELKEEHIIQAVKNGFLKLDEELKDKLISPEDRGKNTMYPNFLDKSGTTVVACLITKKHIYLINCGDSRGILVRRNAHLELVTYDHKPSQLKEKQRIQNAGGMIALNRVNGGLATSRGIGDFEYKCVINLEPYQQFVSPEPDFYVIERDPANDHFIVLACDGIWDVKKTEEVVEFVSERIDEPQNHEEMEKITNDLVDNCFDLVSLSF